MKVSKKNTVVGGLAWSFAERIATQLVSTIISVILARILLPEDYGVISIVMVFISLCDVLVTSGIGSALVQKKEIDTIDFDTAFALSMGLAFCLYLLLFVLAPLISNIYETHQLTSILRVLGLRLFVAAYNNIQQSFIRRSMEFRRFFSVTIWGTVISGVFGVVLAVVGCGVWALVLQYLTNGIVNTILTFRICAWKPKRQFSLQCAKAIMSFGGKVLCSHLIATLQNDLRSLIVGKVFGAADLAYYDQGKKFPSLLITNVDSSINRVMLPVFSALQEEKLKLKQMLRKAIRVGTYVVAPLLLGLFSVADSFVIVVLTEKWISIVPYLQIFCVLFLTRPLEEICYQAVNAIGRSDISLRILAVINTTALVAVAVAIFVFRSVYFVALFSLANSVVSVICFMGATNKLLDYKTKEQLADVMPSLLIAAVMCIIVMSLNSVPINMGLRLILQILVGIVIYVLVSELGKVDAYLYLKRKLNVFMK